MTDFLDTRNSASPPPAFGAQWNTAAGNPYQASPQQNGYQGGAAGRGYQAGGMDPNSMYQSASMLYQQLGYMNGSPTEVDIIADLLSAQQPLAKFLASDNGLPIMAQLFSALFDFKMTSFFKEFRLAIIQDEAGAMFIAPATEQITERGKALATTTQAEVQAEMAKISDTLRNTLIAGSEMTINTHRQAASMKMQSSGLASVLDEATGAQAGGPGGLARLINFTARAAGAPIPPLQNGQTPPPPPGR
mgnify:CR=1 FL=1